MSSPRLQRSNALPLFSHIERIDSPTAWTLDIHLTPARPLAAVVVKPGPGHRSLPHEWRVDGEFLGSIPVGTGPYCGCA